MENNSPKIRVTFTSDWHIGTGTGIPGDIDRLIIRDADGFPCIPAKTLNGIWRDAMEMMTDRWGGDWNKWVDFIFGIQPNAIKKAELKTRLEKNDKTYSFSELDLQPARISKRLRDKIGGDERLKQALTFVKSGIKIDDKSGTAQENHLRFEEMARSGTVLETDFTLQTEDETAKALLVLSATLVERLGGKRRRGAGKCEFTVDHLMSKAEAFEHLKSLEGTEIPIPIETVTDTDDFDFENSEKSNEWQTVEYKLTIHTPISIVTAVLGNVSESLDFIPGTYLLPHITKNLTQQIRSAAANGDLQVSPATVAINGKRGLPVPKVLAKEKVKRYTADESGNLNSLQPIYNRLIQKLEKEMPQTKPVRSGYVENLNETGKLTLFEENLKTLLIHNTVEDEKQRPTSEVGGVFSREAIKAGTIMLGEIRWKNSLKLDNLSNLNGSVRLGTSKKDDYGLAEFTIDEKPQKAESKAVKTDKLYVYLESDVLLRNKNLRQTNLVKNLAETLGEKLEVKLKESKSDGLLSSLIQVRRIESWHVGWGFPRPTLTAMAAGSCVVFDIKGELDEAKIKETEVAGIGERRGEGYGRICFNPPLLMAEIKSWKEGINENSGDSGGEGELSDVEKKFAELIELTAWREELKIAALKTANDAKKRNEIFGFDADKDSPPMAQIGNLRAVISRVREFKDKDLVLSWLEHLKATKNRREKWSGSSLKSIEDLFTTDKKVWEHLEANWNEIAELLTNKEQMQKKLWAEAVRTLFYACQHAHKRTLEKETKTQGAANG